MEASICLFAPRSANYNRFRSMRGGVYTIEGLIGVGKTTLGRSLERYLNENGLEAKFFPEYVNKELLSQYIKDMKRYAYAFQMVMLCKRIEIYRQAELFSRTGGISLIDRSIVGDMTFARMQMENGYFTPEEWAVYLNLVKSEIQLAPTASLYLRCTAATSLERVKSRGNESEINGYTYDYMNKLHNAYTVSFSHCTDLRHIVIEWDSPQLLEDGSLPRESVEGILQQLL